tara:strand:+ start:456 stop:1655 length:1200 start_codon:yes stop_codon:yes gene_type:complete
MSSFATELKADRQLPICVNVRAKIPFRHDETIFVAEQFPEILLIEPFERAAVFCSNSEKLIVDVQKVPTGLEILKIFFTSKSEETKADSSSAFPGHSGKLVTHNVEGLAAVDSSVDLVTLYFVLSRCRPEEYVNILQAVRRAMRPGALLCFCDYGSSSIQPHFAAAYSRIGEHTLKYTHQSGQFSIMSLLSDNFQSLVEDANFQTERFHQCRITEENDICNTPAFVVGCFRAVSKPVCGKFLSRHLTSWPANLEARASMLGSEAGDGLFACRDFAAGTLVCTYMGTNLSTGDAIKLVDKSYLMRLGAQRYINARDFHGVAARYINDCRNSALYNVEFRKIPEQWKAEVIALRDITAGEELFVDYGRWYWLKVPYKRLSPTLTLELLRRSKVNDSPEEKM